MPTFRLGNIPLGSRLKGTVSQGGVSVGFDILEWGLGSGGVGTDASFTIERVHSPADADLVAPSSNWFRATNYSGFAVTPANDDAGNVWDPAQTHLTHIWTFPDEGYTHLVTPNIPDAWKDRTVAYGRKVNFVFTTPGAKTVSCFVFDEEGNYATATYTFNNSGGDAAEIQDPDTFFSGNKTICFSQDGNFTAAPTGSDNLTTIGAIGNRLVTRANGGDTFCRVLLRRGEVYENLGSIANSSGGPVRGVYYGCYGNPSDPPPKVKVTSGGAMFNFGGNLNRYAVLSDIDMEGGWDSTREIGYTTGWTTGVGGAWYAPCLVLLHRVRISGFDSAGIMHREGGTSNRVLHDVDITNWHSYAFFITEANGAIRPVGMINCDFHQHVDALTGINQGTSRQEPTNFGNLHSFRWSNAQTTYISRTSFFGRNKWSTSSPADYISTPPTAAPEGIRFGTVNAPPVLNFHVFERVHFECGFQLAQNGNNGPTTNGHKNMVFDKILQSGTWLENSTISTVYEAVEFRNIYTYLSDITARNSSDVTSSFFGYEGTPTTVGAGPVRAYNVTVLNNRQLGGLVGFGSLDPNYIAGSTIENCIVAAPNRTPAIGADLLLGTDPIPGVTLRHKGNKWNFCPIGGDIQGSKGNFGGPILVGSVRELGPGNVLNGEWVVLDYPDYTGRNNGDGFLVTKEILEGNSTHFHQVSVNTFPDKRMSPTSAAANFPGGNGKIVVDLDRNPGQISVQNNSGGTWAADGEFWLLLDLSDYLMDFVPNTGHFGQGVPLPRPAAGSSALSPIGSVFAGTDFFGELTQIRPNGSTITNQFAGAVAPA